MNQFITYSHAIVKAQKYCAYQERCHQEIRNKLYEWGVNKAIGDEIIVQLIDANFLNEERFAQTFARGKFRIKRWGRVKITNELKKRNISDYCIQKALLEIDEEEYLQTLREVLKKRKISRKEAGGFNQKGNLAAYLIARGFEAELVWKEIEN